MCFEVLDAQGIFLDDSTIIETDLKAVNQMKMDFNFGPHHDQIAKKVYKALEKTHSKYECSVICFSNGYSYFKDGDYLLLGFGEIQVTIVNMKSMSIPLINQMISK